MNDNQYTIAVCDSHKQYASVMGNHISNLLGGKCDIQIVSSIQILESICTKQRINVLVISESTYEDVVEKMGIETKIILAESDEDICPGAIKINRFQDVACIMNEILINLPDDCGTDKKYKTNSCKAIGVYSPIRRSLQTTFAMTIGQMLAEKKKVLYLNFENYSGFSGMFNREFESDIVDILYFLDCDKSKLERRIQMAVHRVGNLDILPPAKSYIDTYDCTGAKWIELFKTIGEMTDYEYIILDLTDAMQGLIEVLGYCERVYTMVQNDTLSMAKLSQYEDWMKDHSYVEIMSKTREFNLPVITDIPTHPEMLTKSELGAYVKAIINDDDLILEEA